MDFPILVYRDDEDQGVWIAVSILTCTTGSGRTEEEAVCEAAQMLSRELEEALNEAGGDIQAAMKMVLCSAPEDVQHRFYLASRDFSSARCAPSPAVRQMAQRDLRYIPRLLTTFA